MQKRVLPVLEPIWAAQNERVIAGCSTRHGGISPAPFDSLNLGDHVGDAQDNVESNRERLFESVGLDPRRLVTMSQVHGSSVRYVDRPGKLNDSDGLVTNVRDLILGVAIADCAAVLFYDPVAEVIGACHAGWRGAVGGIVPATLEMLQSCGSKPADLLVWVSPCISSANFEVGEEVANLFDPRYVHHYPGREKPHINLVAAIQRQTVSVGVPEESLIHSEKCTVAENDELFSYRAEKGRTGRMLAYIALRN